MAKTKQKTVNLFKELAEATNGSVMSDEDSAASYFIDTGNLALNYICSGKFLKGGLGNRVSEFYGPPATAKSLLGACVAAGAQRSDMIAIWLDIERAAGGEFMKQAGHVNIDELLVYELSTFEEVERKITNTTRAIKKILGEDKKICYILDSIGILQTEREWSETKLSEEYTATEFKKIVGSKCKPGERALASGGFLRKINPFLKENDGTLMIINQVRSTIGGYGNPEISAGGGRALEFICSNRTRTSAKKKIMDSKFDIPIGVNLKFENKKNRSFSPFLFSEGIQLYFKYGINSLGGLLSLLLASERIEMTAKGHYSTLEPYSNGDPIKFKASKERNDIPLDVILKCPALIDGETASEVEKYLEPFMDAITISNSDKVKEVDVNDDLEEFLGTGG